MEVIWNNLICGYRREAALNMPFSGKISEPGIYAIEGPNGCGKSTFLKTLLGLVKPLEGEVSLGLVHADTSKGLSYVPQTHGVNPFFPITVRHFIGYGKVNGVNRKKTDELLAQWGLAPYAERSFHELSIGQKTRAMVARALASEPHILFLDEPLASLDVHCQQSLMSSLYESVKNSGLIVVLVDHHLGAFENNLAGKIVFDRGQSHDESLVVSGLCNVSFVSP